MNRKKALVTAAVVAAPGLRPRPGLSEPAGVRGREVRGSQDLPGLPALPALPAVAHPPGCQVAPTHIGIGPSGRDFEQVPVDAVKVAVADKPGALHIRRGELRVEPSWRRVIIQPLDQAQGVQAEVAGLLNLQVDQRRIAGIDDWVLVQPHRMHAQPAFEAEVLTAQRGRAEQVQLKLALA